MNASRRQLQMYDPATKKITTLDVCFSTHHLQFDKNGRSGFSSAATPIPSSVVRHQEMGRGRMTNKRAKAGRRSSSTPMGTARPIPMSNPISRSIQKG